MNAVYWGSMGVVAILVTMAFVTRFWGYSRDRQRRRKNYGRVVAKARRPFVMLNVRAYRNEVAADSRGRVLSLDHPKWGKT